MLPRSTLGLVSSAVPLSATMPARSERQRGAKHGADVAGVLHAVEHDSTAAGRRRNVVEGPLARLDDGHDALGLLGVGQLVELAVVTATDRTAAQPRARS